jgi:hypothetical protein
MKRATLHISEQDDFSEMFPTIATIGVKYLHLCEQCQSHRDRAGVTHFLRAAESAGINGGNIVNGSSDL